MQTPMGTEEQANKAGAGKEGSDWPSFREIKLKYQRNYPDI